MTKINEVTKSHKCVEPKIWGTEKFSYKNVLYNVLYKGFFVI